MKINAAFVTTFPNDAWGVYAEECLKSWVENLPVETPILIGLDDDKIALNVQQLLQHRNDAIAVGMLPEQKNFVETYKHKDEHGDYRKQATRFCHKVFILSRALEAIRQTPKENKARYLIWLDADVLVSRKVNMSDIMDVLPVDGEPVAYLGRKDWDHSECGLLVFDLENGGDKVIENVLQYYLTGNLFSLEQWHDSFVFDVVRGADKWTNLTEGKPGRDIWEHSPMASWSHHYKGNQKHGMKKIPANAYRVGNMLIETKNALPNEVLHSHIADNKLLIREWVSQCEDNEEEIVVVSAGPLLVPEDVLKHIEKGQKIVAVKHALSRLKDAGIKPWATILLDPRPHVYDFVQSPDKDIIWFVASQVDPIVTKKLLEHGCRVIGYHVTVGANEEHLFEDRYGAIIPGGTATATRGLFLLRHLGFKTMHLYGYDMCYGDKPDMKAVDEKGQPKYVEMSIDVNNFGMNYKRVFWSEPQLMAQINEMQQLLKNRDFNFRAYGWGIVPFIARLEEVADLRKKKKLGIVSGKKLPSYKDLLKCPQKKNFLAKLLKAWQKILLKHSKDKN